MGTALCWSNASSQPPHQACSRRSRIPHEVGTDRRWALLNGYAREGVHQLASDWPIYRDVNQSWSTNATLATRVPARYVEAAVGRRISRRWALNSRFCRAMKMSRLINTSGSRSRSHPRFPVSLPPPPVPPPPSAYPLPLPLPLPLLLPVHSTPQEKRERSCSFVCGLYGFACFFGSPLYWRAIK